MQNPFVYGEVVPGSAFVDRQVELDRLVEDLATGQKVFLISPRRYGKSSLVRHALAAMTRRGALAIDVTVSDPLVKAFADASATGFARPQSAEFANYWGPFGDAVTKIIEGKSTPAAGIAEACKAMNTANKK